MNRKLFLPASIALLALLLPGCTPQQVKPPFPDLTREQVVSLLDQRVASLRTLSATLSMKVKLSGMKNTEDLTASFAAAGPSKIRLRAEHALVDYKVLDLGCDASTWWVKLHYQDTDRVDYGALADLDRSNQDVPLRPDQVVAILGMTPLRDNPPDSHWVFTVHHGYYLLQEVARADGAQFVATRIFIDGDTNLITRYETLFSSGRPDMSATIDKYTTVSNVPIPRTINIRLLSRKEEGRLVLNFSDVKVNPELPAGVFVAPDFKSVPRQIRHPLSPQADLYPVSPSPIARVP